MAKVSLGTVANILGNPTSAATTINNNSALLIAAIENTLSRDGTTPNQMEADIDLNNNDLLNVRTLEVDSLLIDGQVVIPDDLSSLPDIVMTKPVYDPQGIEADVFAQQNHTGDLYVRKVSTKAALKAVDTTKYDTVYLNDYYLDGIFKWTPGDFSIQVAVDSLEGIFVASNLVAVTSGVWQRMGDWESTGINPQWFGALPGSSSVSFTHDSADAFVCALNTAAIVGCKISIPSGFYLSSKRLNIPSGITVEGLGTNEMWELPFFDTASMTLDRGVTICFIGTGTRDLQLDFCSDMRHDGAYRTNISRLYTNAFDQFFTATDFTNSDAVTPANSSTVTRATLKSFSAAVTLGSDGLSGKTILRNIRFVPACNDGVTHLGGYLSANSNLYTPWVEWDVGLISYNPYTTVVEDCQFAGYWNLKGCVQTSIRFGNTQSGGRGEMAIWERNFFQNGFAIRQGDFYPALAKTANSFTVEWAPGHRFIVGGTVYVDSVAYPITGLTQNTTGNGQIVITTSAATTSIEVTGNDRSVVHMTNNNGTTQSIVRECNVRDFWHSSLVERPSTVFGAQAGKYSAAIELVGYPLRGVTFFNNTIYTQEPFFIMQQGARDIMWFKGTYEEKSYRTALGGPTNPGGSFQGLIYVGPSTSFIATWPMLLRGANTLIGYPWSARAVVTPVIIATTGRRYSSVTDAYGGFRLEWKGRESGDEDLIWDARLPERYVISSGVLTAYTRHFTIDTEGSAATDDLTNILPANLGLQELVFSTTSSTRDVVIKHQAGGTGQFYCKSGADTTLFSPITPVMFTWLNGVWYQI